MIEHSQNSHMRFKERKKVRLFQIERIPNSYMFLPDEHKEICEAIYRKIPLEKMLKHIHQKFSDEGLLHTLVHRIYDCSNVEIEFYVPELVYMAVQKYCKPIKKLLIQKAKNCINLRRLILWNIRAFTVLMKQRDPEMKRFCNDFQEEILKTVPNRNKFDHSEKAISMLTTASLILKKMPPESLKNKLKKFIKNFNVQILNNLNHSIMIPFRRDETSVYNSNYMVRIIEQNCSCFPTRKRVPYRIIIETIDPNQLQIHQPHRSFFSKTKNQPQKDRDLYREVIKQVEETFGYKSKFNRQFAVNEKYPFIIDEYEHVNMSQLMKYAKDVQNKEKQEKKQSTIGYKVKSNMRKMGTKIFGKLSDRQNPNANYQKKTSSLYNQQLDKFDATYIPTLPADKRKSENQTYSRQFYSAKKLYHSHRWSDRSEQNEQNIKIIEEEPKWTGPTVWGQIWTRVQKDLKSSSPFHKFNSVKYRNVVIKGGDDLRQEIICMQLIYKMENIIKNANIDLFIKPYEIIVLSQNSGLLEFVSNSISIDGLKKQTQLTLKQFYHEYFPSETSYLKAKSKFITSLAGSSILTYVLNLKDRHNGNILIDNEGRIIHIDFGFILGLSPGGLNFESSPFKLTEEYVELMEGKNSLDYEQFKDLFCEGMMALRKKGDELCLLLSIMMDRSDLDCFQNFRIQNFKDRFKLQMNDEKYRKHCESLVERSCMNSRTVHYDTFQKITNNIMP